jgi:putative nucleotidyltransferase with HDIG domain
MLNNNGTPKSYRSVSHSFKLAVVALLFFLILVHLGMAFYFPNIDIISDKVVLFILLFIAAYLWIQELRDYYVLLALHKGLQRAYEQLKQSEIDTIAALIKTEEEKDVDTRGHSERVARISLAIADEMGMDAYAKNTIFRAGILHDIGKIGVNDTILNKVEKLTDAEWSVIKSHPRIAIEILDPLKFLARERNIILSHHERYDGKGYPEGLKGEEICIEARIMAVADAFDAMNSRRAYRDALPREKIISELNGARDTQFSAQIVDIFIRLLEKRPSLWER